MKRDGNETIEQDDKNSLSTLINLRIVEDAQRHRIHNVSPNTVSSNIMLPQANLSEERISGLQAILYVVDDIPYLYFRLTPQLQHILIR